MPSTGAVESGCHIVSQYAKIGIDANFAICEQAPSLPHIRVVALGGPQRAAGPRSTVLAGVVAAG